MKIDRTQIAMALALMIVAGCSNTPKPTAATDPNTTPADYKNEIASYLGTVLTDRADFRSSLIGVPILEQVGAGQHYIVCVQLNGRNQHKDKVVIYLGSTLNQFVDATPGQCANAAYQPFKELATLLPPI